MTAASSAPQNDPAPPLRAASTRRTAVNVVVISLTSILQIMLQFLFFRHLATTYALATQADALAAALAVPTVIAAMLTGSLAYVLVPELVSRFSQDVRSIAGWELAWYTGRLTGLLTGAVSAAVLVLSPAICDLLYDDLSRVARAETIQLLRILSLQVVLTSGISWAQAVYHARHRFQLPAWAGVIGVTSSLLLVWWRGAADIAYFAWAINLGSAVSLAIHLLPMLRHWCPARADAASLGRLVIGLWPLMTGAAIVRLDPLVDRTLADGLQGAGAIAAIYYAQRFLAALLSMGTSSLSLIVFPQLAEHWVRSGRGELARQLAIAVRRMVLLIVPIAVGFGVFAQRIVEDLLVRGQFTMEQGRLVAGLTVALLGVFIGASSGELLARTFYVLGDTRTPTFVGLGWMLLGVIAKVSLFRWWGLWAIPIATSAYFLLSTATMAVLLRRTIGDGFFAGCGRYVALATVCSLLACLCSHAVYASGLGNTWLAAPVGVGAYVASLWVSQVEEVRQLADELRQKVRGAAE